MNATCHWAYAAATFCCCDRFLIALTSATTLHVTQVLTHWQEISWAHSTCPCVATLSVCALSSPLGYPCWYWVAEGTRSAMCPGVGHMKLGSFWVSDLMLFADPTLLTPPC